MSSNGTIAQVYHTVKGWCRVGDDYVVSMYPSPPHTIHPPHIGSLILGESVIVFRRPRIHFNNIVSLLHGIVQSILDLILNLQLTSHNLVNIQVLYVGDLAGLLYIGNTLTKSTSWAREVLPPTL